MASLMVAMTVLGANVKMSGVDSSIEMNGASLTTSCIANEAAFTYMDGSSFDSFAEFGSVLVHFANVRASCAGVRLQEPCAPTGQSSYPALWYCSFQLVGGEANSVVGPVRAMAEELTSSSGIHMGFDVTLSCPAPSWSEFKRITGHAGSLASTSHFSLRLALSYFAPPGSDAAIPIPFDGQLDGDVITVTVSSPSPPPPVSPPPPPSSPPLPVAYVMSLPYGAYTSSGNHASDAIGSGHGRAKLWDPGDSAAWSSVSNSMNSEWVAMDAGSVQSIVGVAIQPRGESGSDYQRVTAFTAFRSDDQSNWTPIDGGATFVGSPTTGPNDEVTYVSFSSPVSARYIKVVPQSFAQGHASMRIGLIVVAGAAASVPTSDFVYVISPDYGAFTSSGNHAGDAIGSGHGRVRLYDPGDSAAWSSVSNSMNSEWVAMDAGSVQSIVGVAIQPRGESGSDYQRVTAFTAFRSDDQSNWTPIDGGATFVGSPTTGPNDEVTYVSFSSPVSARYIKVVPQSFAQGHASMRIGLMYLRSLATGGRA